MRRLAAIALPLLALVFVALTIWQTSRTPRQRPAGDLDPLLIPTLSGTATARASLVPPSPTPAPLLYTVTAGDTLLAIALQYDVDLDTLQAANELADPDTLDVGQKLVIPGVYLPTPRPLPAAAADLPPKPAGLSVNGLPESAFILFSDEARSVAQETFARGQALGRNPRAFTTAGDSTTEIPFFLGRFDEGPYNLGDYAYLQPVVDAFQGSFNHDSASVRVGLHSWTLFDPAWADEATCLAGEAPLPCEIRQQNPSILFIRLGSNDYGVPELFDKSIREAVEYALEQGVIPVIGTKADRGEGSDQNNALLRQIAADYDLLLWDFDLVAGTLPDRGLDEDHVHMTTFYAHDYTQPEAFLRGHSLHNLTALMVLDTLWKEVILAAD